MVESESLASIDQANPPLSLAEKHLSHVFSRLKIHHHISISERKHKSTFLGAQYLAECQMVVTSTWFSILSYHKSPVAQW